MKFLAFKSGGREGLAVSSGAGFNGLFVDEAGFPGTLSELVAKGGDALKAAGQRLAQGAAVNEDAIEFLPPLPNPGKIICLGLNFADHAAEGGMQVPVFPTVFARFPSGLVGHNAPIIRPKVSEQLDYEGEMVAVIGKGGRHIDKASALDHVVAYSIFNDGSIRDYQLKTPQWTVGKNFDGTGPFGPYLVTPDEIPAGGKGLKLETRLNGQVMQSANTDDMIFDVQTTIALLTECMTLNAGDILVMGTPAGIGLTRTPPVFMKHGDICEISIEGLGVLRNTIVDEGSLRAAA